MKYRLVHGLFFCTFFFSFSAFAFRLIGGEHFPIESRFDKYIYEKFKDLSSYFETGRVMSTASFVSFFGHQLTNSDGIYFPKIKH